MLAEHSVALADAVRTRLAVVLTLATAAFQLLAWWLESRRLAVGMDGRFYFLADAGWAPPAGWALWLAAMLAGTGLYVGSAAAALRPTPRAPSSRRPGAP